MSLSYELQTISFLIMDLTNASRTLALSSVTTPSLAVKPLSLRGQTCRTGAGNHPIMQQCMMSSETNVVRVIPVLSDIEWASCPNPVIISYQRHSNTGHRGYQEKGFSRVDSGGQGCTPPLPSRVPTYSTEPRKLISRHLSFNPRGMCSRRLHVVQADILKILCKKNAPQKESLSRNRVTVRGCAVRGTFGCLEGTCASDK
jgi:hypothetical protein